MDLQVHESKAMVIYAIKYGDCKGVNFKNVSWNKETWPEEGSTLHNFNQEFVDNDLINQVPMALREVSRLNNMYWMDKHMCLHGVYFFFTWEKVIPPG